MSISNKPLSILKLYDFYKIVNYIKLPDNRNDYTNDNRNDSIKDNKLDIKTDNKSDSNILDNSINVPITKNSNDNAKLSPINVSLTNKSETSISQSLQSWNITLLETDDLIDNKLVKESNDVLNNNNIIIDFNESISMSSSAIVTDTLIEDIDVSNSNINSNLNPSGLIKEVEYTYNIASPGFFVTAIEFINCNPIQSNKCGLKRILFNVNKHHVNLKWRTLDTSNQTNLSSIVCNAFCTDLTFVCDSEDSLNLNGSINIYGYALDIIPQAYKLCELLSLSTLLINEKMEADLIIIDLLCGLCLRSKRLFNQSIEFLMRSHSRLCNYLLESGINYEENSIDMNTLPPAILLLVAHTCELSTHGNQYVYLERAALQFSKNSDKPKFISSITLGFVLRKYETSLSALSTSLLLNSPSYFMYAALFCLEYIIDPEYCCKCEVSVISQIWQASSKGSVKFGSFFLVLSQRIDKLAPLQLKAYLREVEIWIQCILSQNFFLDSPKKGHSRTASISSITSRFTFPSDCSFHSFRIFALLLSKSKKYLPSINTLAQLYYLRDKDDCTLNSKLLLDSCSTNQTRYEPIAEQLFYIICENAINFSLKNIGVWITFLSSILSETISKYTANDVTEDFNGSIVKEVEFLLMTIITVLDKLKELRLNLNCISNVIESTFTIFETLLLSIISTTLSQKDIFPPITVEFQPPGLVLFLPPSMWALLWKVFSIFFSLQIGVNLTKSSNFHQLLNLAPSLLSSRTKISINDYINPILSYLSLFMVDSCPSEHWMQCLNYCLNFYCIPSSNDEKIIFEKFITDFCKWLPYNISDSAFDLIVTYISKNEIGKFVTTPDGYALLLKSVLDPFTVKSLRYKDCLSDLAKLSIFYVNVGDQINFLYLFQAFEYLKSTVSCNMKVDIGNEVTNFISLCFLNLIEKTTNHVIINDFLDKLFFISLTLAPIQFYGFEPIFIKLANDSLFQVRILNHLTELLDFINLTEHFVLILNTLKTFFSLLIPSSCYLSLSIKSFILKLLSKESQFQCVESQIELIVIHAYICLLSINSDEAITLFRQLFPILKLHSTIFSLKFAILTFCNIDCNTMPADLDSALSKLVLVKRSSVDPAVYYEYMASYSMENMILNELIVYEFLIVVLNLYDFKLPFESERSWCFNEVLPPQLRKLYDIVSDHTLAFNDDAPNSASTANTPLAYFILDDSKKSFIKDEDLGIIDLADDDTSTDAFDEHFSVKSNKTSTLLSKNTKPILELQNDPFDSEYNELISFRDQVFSHESLEASNYSRPVSAKGRNRGDTPNLPVKDTGSKNAFTADPSIQSRSKNSQNHDDENEDEIVADEVLYSENADVYILDESLVDDQMSSPATSDDDVFIAKEDKFAISHLSSNSDEEVEMIYSQENANDERGSSQSTSFFKSLKKSTNFSKLLFANLNRHSRNSGNVKSKEK